MNIKIKLLLFCMGLSTFVFGQLSVPALSPSAKTVQIIGLTNVSINYARPSVRDRTIFGEKGLIPFGEIWRVGANAATKITIDNTIEMGGQTLEKGEYAILAKPEKVNWTFYLYPYESSSWGSYLKKEPLKTIVTTSTQSTEKAENLAFGFQNITFNSADLVLAWEHTQVRIPITVDTETQVAKNMKQTFDGPSNSDYFLAAVYLHETNTELEKALTYIQKVTANEKAFFFQVYREAAILKDLNQKTAALAAAKKSLALSEKAGNNDFVRLNEQLIKELGG